MVQSVKFPVLVILLKFFILGQATFLDSSCCCNCGIPMPPSCGCSLPICPPPVPCPPPICPVCKVCSSTPACPPPPIPLCPPPQPIYLPNCGCDSTNVPAGGYSQPSAYPSAGGYASPVGPNSVPPPHGGSYGGGYQQAGLPNIFSSSPASIHPNHLLARHSDLPTPPAVQQPFPVQNEDEKLSDLTFPDHQITNQILPISSTTASLTEWRAHGAVIISENKCNGVELRDLLLQNMDQADPVISKRAIHKAARETMREDEVDIICSDAGFTYIVSATEYCEVQKERVICFIYKKNK